MLRSIINKKDDYSRITIITITESFLNGDPSLYYINKIIDVVQYLNIICGYTYDRHKTYKSQMYLDKSYYYALWLIFYTDEHPHPNNDDIFYNLKQILIIKFGVEQTDALILKIRQGII